MRKLILGFICVWFILCMPAHSSASVSVPYKTETLSADGETIETQTAYVPIGLFGKSAMYESPQDLHLHHNSEVYVADSERQLVIRVSPDGTLIREYGAGILQQLQEYMSIIIMTFMLLIISWKKCYVFRKRESFYRNMVVPILPFLANVHHTSRKR